MKSLAVKQGLFLLILDAFYYHYERFYSPAIANGWNNCVAIAFRRTGAFL